MKQFKTEAERIEALRESSRRASRRYYQNHKEKVIAAKKAYYWANREKMAAWQRDYFNGLIDIDLYTKDELMNPPDGETGRLSPRFWELINEVKQELRCGQ